MRCVDVVRELAVPTGALEPTALEEHLEACPACAAEAEQARRLEQIWEETRPVTPAAAWPAIWQRVMHAADPALRPATLPMTADHPRGWRRSVVIAGLFANAAAVLLVATALLWRAPAGSPAQGIETKTIAGAQTFEFELEPGQTLFLELDQTGDRVVCKPRFEDTAQLVAAIDDPDSSGPVSLAWDMVILNFLESNEWTSSDSTARTGPAAG